MILHTVTLICDFEDCENSETFDSGDSRVWEASAIESDWFYGGEFGEHFCSQHNSDLNTDVETIQLLKSRMVSWLEDRR